jgi:hypothetical protein
MKDPCPPPWQRKRLFELLNALAVAKRCSGQATIRRDDCDDFAIWGRDGHIYAVPEGYQLVIGGESPRRWHFVKQRLAFCRLAQDGDCEGTMFLTQLPTAAEAGLIREALGLRKTADISPECRANKIRDGKALRARQNGKSKPTHTRVAA